MADDDFLTKFKEAFKGKTAASPPSQPTLPPELTRKTPPAARKAYEAYEALENEVRTSNVEIRCHRTGLAYYFDYAHITVPVFTFATGEGIYFTGGGYGVVIKGRALGRTMLALRMKSCSAIQDFNPEKHILPEPLDPEASFVESISVELLHGDDKPKVH